MTPSHPVAADDAHLRPTEERMDQYEFRVRGRVTPPLLARFEGLQSQVEPVETVLHGPLADQAALHGVIDLVRALGLELVQVRKIAGRAPRRSGPEAGDREAP